MAKIKILFFILSVLNSLSYLNDTGYRLIQINGQRIVNTARSQLGVTESTGKNDGKMVETYLRYTNMPKGKPWCAAFVSWVFGKSGFPAPRTAWSPSLFPIAKRSTSAHPGFIYALYDPKKQRIVHCGIIVKKHNKWILGIEGNTNPQGGVDGYGVFLKRRHQSTLHTMANWLPSNH